jgi:hypothetical protein
MGFRTICNCDFCDAAVDVTDGFKPARINVYPPTPPEIGHQQDEHYMCDECWAKLCNLFPKVKEAERFCIPVPATPPTRQVPNEMDTWTPEQVLVALAKRLGVEVKETPPKE